MPLVCTLLRLHRFYGRLGFFGAFCRAISIIPRFRGVGLYFGFFLGGGGEVSILFSLRTLASLNKESRPCFLGGNSISSFPSLSLLLVITAFGGPEGYFSLAILAFGAFEFIVPKYYCRLGMEIKESRLLI